MKNNYVVSIGNVYGGDWHGGYAGEVFDSNYFCPALTTMSGGGRQPMVVVTYNH